MSDSSKSGMGGVRVPSDLALPLQPGGEHGRLAVVCGTSGAVSYAVCPVYTALFSWYNSTVMFITRFGMDCTWRIRTHCR